MLMYTITAACYLMNTLHRSPVMLAEFFETLFPGQVHSATICLNLEDLTGLIAPRDIALQKLNKASNVIMATGKDVMVRHTLITDGSQQQYVSSIIRMCAYNSALDQPPAGALL
jgi:hypothetical protein